MSRWSPVYAPEIETGRHVKNNVCTVEIKIKWMIRQHMTYENTYRDDTKKLTKKDFIYYYIIAIKWGESTHFPGRTGNRGETTRYQP
jgi:hypothetical protein